MKIACLGWGSLIWRPQSLLIRSEWFHDGPFLPIEFTRQSDDGRLTLVITEGAKPLRTLWALMSTDDLVVAKDSLRVRENIGRRSLINKISVVSKEELIENDTVKSLIQNWAINLGLDAVIWTDIPSRFNDEFRILTVEEAVNYFKSPSLDFNIRKNAEEYIRKAPKQIDTDFRRRFETEFGWSFIK